MYANASGPIPVLERKAGQRRTRLTIRGRCIRSAGIGVLSESKSEPEEQREKMTHPAGLVELQGDVDDGLVIQELSAEEPVASMETCQVATRISARAAKVRIVHSRANVTDLAIVVEIGEVKMVSYGGCLCESLAEETVAKKSY
jgi:hypothetical protein